MKIGRLLMTGVVASAAFMVVSCAATPTRETAGRALDDAAITAHIKAALIADPVTKSRQIDVKTYRGEVLLSGFVDSNKERADAARIARHEPGVRSVDNELHIMQRGGGVARVADDAAISAKVKAALIAHPETKAYQIDVTTLHGVVDLSGFVDSNEEREAATQVAQSVSGVRSVHNDLQLKPAPQ